MRRCGRSEQHSSSNKGGDTPLSCVFLLPFKQTANGRLRRRDSRAMSYTLPTHNSTSRRAPSSSTTHATDIATPTHTTARKKTEKNEHVRNSANGRGMRLLRSPGGSLWGLCGVVLRCTHAILPPLVRLPSAAVLLQRTTGWVKKGIVRGAKKKENDFAAVFLAMTTSKKKKNQHQNHCSRRFVFKGCGQAKLLVRGLTVSVGCGSFESLGVKGSGKG